MKSKQKHHETNEIAVIETKPSWSLPILTFLNNVVVKNTATPLKWLLSPNSFKWLCSNTRSSYKTMPQNAPRWKRRASRKRQKSAQRCVGGLQAHRPVRAKRREVERRMRMAWVATLWASVHSALWVGVLGWWRPMILHIHPAKSTSSTSARLMNVWPCKWISINCIITYF